MPLSSGEPPPQDKAIAELLMPFGHGQIDSVYAGRMNIDLTVICSEFPPAVPEIRAMLLRRAEEAVAVLEANGYEIRETRITLTRPPVMCTVRFEVSSD